MQELFAALPALIETHGDIVEVRRSLIFAVWRRIAGEELSARTEPVDLDDRRLIVAVADEMWRRHLGSLSAELIFKLNAAIGHAEVRFIEFRVDTSVIGPKGPTSALEKRLATEALNEVGDDLRREASVISDEDVRQQFLLAAGSCLVRKKRNNL